MWNSLGPGLITGAADDDPSSIITYTIAGAKFGLATLWMALFSLPFMIIIQRMAGRIGLVSGHGLAGNMKKHYPKWILVIMALLITAANIINIGADISGMAAASALLIPSVSPILFSIIVSIVIILALLIFSYRQIAHYLKWVAILMMAYIAAAFLVQQNWLEILKHTFLPQIIWSKEYLLIMAAFFGTTISPYLFFWQASEEVEEEVIHRQLEKGAIPMILDVQPHGSHRSSKIIKNEISSMYKDIGFGMIFSNLITFFIIILSSATLFKHGSFNISMVEEVASILKPLAGPYANLLFLTGIIASGILAIPVLAGSAAYAISELFGWKFGFENKLGKAKQFYAVIAVATLLGILIPVFHLHPIQILFYTAIIYGAISPAMILMLIHMANNPKIMGQYISHWPSNILAYILFLLMTTGIVLTFVL